MTRIKDQAAQAPGSENPNLSSASDESTPLRSRLASLAQELTRRWSTKIDIKGSDMRGKIVVHYRSRQDLDRVLGAMQNSNIWQGPAT